MAHKNSKKAFNKYKNHCGDLSLWIAFKKARAHMRYTFKLAKENAFKEYASGINSTVTTGDVWRKIKNINNHVTNKTIILKQDNKNIVDEKEISEVFVKQFSKCSDITSEDGFFKTRRTLLSAPINFDSTAYAWYNKDFEINELTRTLQITKSTTPGPDFIPTDFLSKMTIEHQLKLLNFYNYIWHHGFPRQWTESIIIPILKFGKISTDGKSYRPIALTNCVCKILERMVNYRLMCYIETKNLLNPYQSGFRRGHSTLDGLCRLESDIRLALLRGEYCIGIFLDFVSAFDEVWHNGLLLKLHEMGLHGRLPNFIKGFLTERRIAVRINNAMAVCQCWYSTRFCHQSHLIYTHDK